MFMLKISYWESGEGVRLSLINLLRLCRSDPRPEHTVSRYEQPDVTLATNYFVSK
jgi:hypothetical protein